MTALLVTGGALIALVVGWWLGRSTGRPADVNAPGTDDALVAVTDDVLDAHATGVVVAAADGSVEYRNAAARALAGTHVGILIDEAVARHIGRAVREGSSQEVLDLFGPPKRVVAVSARRLDSGRVAAFVDDISDRRRVDQVRTDFVANVSHELRTPIGALLALADTLADADDPEVVERVVARMQGEAERASRTIDDLLELSQLESGLERSVGPVRLGDVVRDGVGRASELAARRSITISTLDAVDDVGPRAERLVVEGDRPQLASAIGNVVENAVKYSDPGDTVQVRVREADGWGEIVVVDEGAGIPRDHLDRIFERFYRVDRARSRSTGGTGLGLSIVRHVAENHRGTVSVESVEGEGTTFVLRLPLARSTDENDRDTDEGVVA